jgi:hypothetical protein
MEYIGEERRVLKRRAIQRRNDKDRVQTRRTVDRRKSEHTLNVK